MPALTPEDTEYWTPVTYGPTWQKDARGLFLFPEHTLFFEFFEFCVTYLRNEGTTYLPSLEQSRFAAWFLEINPETLEFANPECVLQRMKGFGKSPLGAAIALFMCFGRSLPVSVDEEGNITCTTRTEAWVQIVGVTISQTENILKSAAGMVKDNRKALGIEVNKWSIVAKDNPACAIEAITSNSSAREGGRPLLVVMDEIQEYTAGNGGIDVYQTVKANAAKVGGILLCFMNAANPNIVSVGSQIREHAMSVNRGETADIGRIFDSVEAPEHASTKSLEEIRRWITICSGDSVWLKVDRAVKEFLDETIPLSESLRKWYNQATVSSTAFMDIRDMDTIARKDKVVREREEIVMFLDCSMGEDGTALIGCRVEDGHIFRLGYWQPVAKKRRSHHQDASMLVDKNLVDDAVRDAFDKYYVSAFWADPSHAKDEVTRDPYWASLIDEWHKDFRSQLRRYPATPGKDGHSINWDMTSSERQIEFVKAVARFREDAVSERFSWDGNSEMRAHFQNAVSADTSRGQSISKPSRRSTKKIDMAVAAIAAYMLRNRVYRRQPGGADDREVFL